jgi:hypothetical protein
LKSGADVFVDRAPIQLLTFLKPIKQVLIIGESIKRLGDFKMVDVYTSLYENTQKRLNDADKKVIRRHDKQADRIEQNSNSIGWKSDAHKNLPGLQLLYNQYPDAEWYIMIDDDTYVFFDNLYETLSKHDFNVPFYLGSPNVFLGCDGVTKFGQVTVSIFRQNARNLYIQLNN